MARDVDVHRLQDVGGWELYELVDGDSSKLVCTLALRYYPEFQHVEYGIWPPGQAEPQVTDSIGAASGGGAWSDAGREITLKEILGKNLEGAVRDRSLVFR
jgi:hypothetical protein